MANARETFYGRRASATALGKDLSRRAKNRCELCRESAPLQVIEVEPTHEEPELDRAVMVCERCAAAIEDKRRRVEPAELRFLVESVWAESLPVQLTAVRLCRRLAERGVDWARDTLDGLYLDPEVEALV
jgi:hypothetical protein